MLGFRNLGQFEKVAWSVPLEYDGRPFLVEHRKFGLGVFAANVPEDEAAAADIVRLIQKATKAAQPYFDWRAEQAAKASKLKSSTARQSCLNDLTSISIFMMTGNRKLTHGRTRRSSLISAK